MVFVLPSQPLGEDRGSGQGGETLELPQGHWELGEQAAAGLFIQQETAGDTALGGQSGSSTPSPSLLLVVSGQTRQCQVTRTFCRLL